MKWSYDHRILNSKPGTVETQTTTITSDQNSLLSTSSSSLKSLGQKLLHQTEIKLDSPQNPLETNASNVIVKCSESSIAKYNEFDSSDLLSISEVDGSLVNLILSDSLLNLFKDHNFDSCNICECTSSVLGSEIGVYLADPELELSSIDPNPTVPSTSFIPNDLVSSAPELGRTNRTCKCGFSAVSNQKYALNANLFYEDEIEVTQLQVRSGPLVNLTNSYLIKPHDHAKRSLGWWVTAFKPSVQHCLLLEQYTSGILNEFFVRQVMDLLRQIQSSRVEYVKENRLEYDSMSSCDIFLFCLFFYTW